MKTNNVILKIDKVDIIEEYRYFFEKACEIIVVDAPVGDTLDVIKNSIPKMVFEFVEDYRPILINLPGYDDTMTVCSYNWHDFLQFLPEKSTIYLLFNVDITSSGFSKEKPTELPNIFSEIVKYEVVNFPLTITELEKRGVVRTQPSQSWLSTDGRVFQIVGNIEDCVSNAMWEVDILGTTFGRQITQKILELYDKI